MVGCGTWESGGWLVKGPGNSSEIGWCTVVSWCRGVGFAGETWPLDMCAVVRVGGWSEVQGRIGGWLEILRRVGGWW